ncbi:MAG: helix-turn-helix transcriptional regulator [Clostridia bacterium]|jgi:transcriptional regulator with XRE-family HTH domain|nr:helix-turn-helix transcriptional regulator [Clostridia bacterium]
MIRLKELRNKSNLSQTALSNILGIPKGSISQWENGVREMSYDTLVKFADFYGCSIDYILGRDTSLGEMSLKRDEVVILSKYRMLSTGAKLKLQGYLDGLGE